MSLTSEQIKDAIRRKLLEEEDDLVTDETIYLNMNLAYEDIKIRTFTTDQVKKATVSFVLGLGTLPTDFGTLYGPGYRSLTDQTPFNEKAIGEMDRNPLEEGLTVESGQLRVTPSTTASLIVKYWPSYTLLTAAQNPTINSYFHESIIYGALWRIHEDLQDEARSEFYLNRYETRFAQKNNSISNYQEDNMGGNSMFNGISII